MSKTFSVRILLWHGSWYTNIYKVEKNLTNSQVQNFVFLDELIRCVLKVTHLRTPHILKFERWRWKQKKKNLKMVENHIFVLNNGRNRYKIHLHPHGYRTSGIKNFIFFFFFPIFIFFQQFIADSTAPPPTFYWATPQKKIKMNIKSRKFIEIFQKLRNLILLV